MNPDERYAVFGNLTLKERAVERALRAEAARDKMILATISFPFQIAFYIGIVWGLVALVKFCWIHS